jgi:hypothetical protein
VVELTRLCALQEFAKCCTNTSLALVNQQSPVGMDLGQSEPSAFLAHAGRAGAGQALVIALTVQHVHQHMHQGVQPTLWIRRTRTHCGLELHDNPTRQARGDHGGGDACTLQLSVCTHNPWYVRCLAWLVGSWASDWQSYGDVTPAARCFLQPCRPVEPILLSH